MSQRPICRRHSFANYFFDLSKNSSSQPGTPKTSNIQLFIMRMHKISWKARAVAKRAATLDKIHPDWRLSSRDIERARQQRDLTGSFIEQFLDEKMVSITSMKSPEIVKAVAERSISAAQVVQAFCKRAAVAHQIVNEFPIHSKTRTHKG
jgi:hypothetical protein